MYTHIYTHIYRNPIATQCNAPYSKVSNTTSHSTHTATHCNTPQHTATHCNTMQHTMFRSIELYKSLHTRCNSPQLIATHCNTLQHTATHCNKPFSEVSSATRRSMEGDMSELNFSCLAPKIRSAANDPRVRRSRPCVAVSCSVLQRVAVFCSELQYVCVDCAHVNM